MRQLFLILFVISMLSLAGCKTTTGTIVAGDSFAALSREYYGSTKHWRLIYEANQDQIPRPDQMRIGLEIMIPPLPEEANELSP